MMTERKAAQDYIDTARMAAQSLFDYCKRHDWAGYDPYDSLNSRVFSATPFSRFKLFRIGLTQVMKRLPVNLRPGLIIPREQNPKGIALFLSSSIKLTRLGVTLNGNTTGALTERLALLRSNNTKYWCWGYNFPWQTRTIIVPRYEPNLVSTTFAANALLDLYEETRTEQYLEMATSGAEYLLKELYWTSGKEVAGFAYPLPTSRSRVHNANFLGSALLCRVYSHTGEQSLLEPALKVARYSASRQSQDGSWDYGELPTQRWIDNFHTGYNLCALRIIGMHARTKEFDKNLSTGFEFYRKHFFRNDHAPKYFHDRVYPIDIHCAAQSIITLLALKDQDKGNVELASAVFKWALDNMRDKNGYFYYQVLPYYKIKIPYMRWSQAWMLLAITSIIEEYVQGIPEAVTGRASKV